MANVAYTGDVIGKARAKTERHPRNKIEAREAMGQCAEDAIGEIVPGINVFRLTNGMFSFIDCIEHVSRSIGPCEMDVSVWSLNNLDLLRCFDLEHTRPMRWLLDPSCVQVKAKEYGLCVELYGIENIRLLKNHSKTITMGNDEYQIAIRGSFNLNHNKRMEQFDLTDGPDVYGVLRTFFDKTWAEMPEDPSPLESKDYYDSLGALPDVGVDFAELGDTIDAGEDFGFDFGDFDDFGGYGDI